MPPPHDQDQRDRIAQDLGRTLFVEAGAGTGKTTALVDRIVNLVVLGHARIDAVAAITFTNLAAVQLRERLLIGLEQASDDPSLDNDSRRRCREALAHLDEAAVETLHAFAQRVLGMFPLEAGLPPGFQVLDAAAAGALFADRWREQLDLMLDDPDLAFPIRYLLTRGIQIDRLRDLARQYNAHQDRVADAPPPQPVDDPVDHAHAILQLVDDALRTCRLRSHCLVDGDKLALHLAQLEPQLQTLRRSADIDLIAALGDLGAVKFTTGGGRKPDWSGITPQEIRDTLAAHRAVAEELLARINHAALTAIDVSLRRFVRDSADQRRRDGTVDFDDLLVLARNLLRSDRDIRRRLRERFSHFLIDEFQDTDPLQTEIAFLLAAAHADPPPPWQDAPVDPGRLFFVGDPKQSIYRFRRADIELYQAVQSRFEDGGGIVRLTQNFRSVPAVIDWVNALFAPMMADGADEGQARYIALRAHRDPHPDGLTATVIDEEHEGAGATRRAREAEAADILRVLHAVKSRPWLVRGHHGVEDGYRPARYQDVAILIPTRTGQGVLLDALDEGGVPYRLESRSLVYDSQEVRDLLSALTAIDDPTDEVALIAALRSPIFACSDLDLLEWRDQRGEWDYLADPPSALPSDQPVRAAMDWLRAIHEQRWNLTLSALVERILRERRLFELALAERRPRERWRRLRFVLDQARAYADGGGTSLRGFLDWTRIQADEGARVVDQVVPEPDDDAVRIMTVHAAKGLEFPIVVLAGLGVSPSNRSPLLLWNADGTPELGLRKDVQTAGYHQREEQEKELETYERIRLLYVAATRAEDHLVVSLHRGSRSAKSYAARIAEQLEELPGYDRAPNLPLEPPPIDDDSDTSDDAVSTPDDTPDSRIAWQRRRDDAVAKLRRQPVSSATVIAKQIARQIARQIAAAPPDPNLEKDEPDDERPPWRRGRAGTSIGRAVHAVLQTVNLDGDGSDIASTAAAQAAAEGVADRATEVAALARSAFDAPSVREAVAGGRYWREVYVAAPLNADAGSPLIDGFIDLLYQTDQGYVVVDYKTDALPEDDATAALRRYRPQAAAYSLALSQALDAPVAAARFLFLRRGEAIEAPVDDLPAAMSEVAAAAQPGS